MKTRLAPILVVLAVAAVVIAVVVLRKPRESPPVPDSPPAVAPHRAAGTPLEAVAAYLEALGEEDFQRAHGHLSARSREVHPYEEFVQMCRAGGGPSYDLAAAREEGSGTERVTVVVPVLQDGAEAGFTAEREPDGWKVVFIGGKPWFPYP